MSVVDRNPVCVARGSEGQAQDWSGGGQICNVAGVPGTQGEDDIETHGFLDFRGISYLHEIVLPGFGNCDGVLRNSRKLLENLNTYCNFYLLQAQPNNFYFKGTFQIWQMFLQKYSLLKRICCGFFSFVCLFFVFHTQREQKFKNRSAAFSLLGWWTLWPPLPALNSLASPPWNTRLNLLGALPLLPPHQLLSKSEREQEGQAEMWPKEPRSSCLWRYDTLRRVQRVVLYDVEISLWFSFIIYYIRSEPQNSQKPFFFLNKIFISINQIWKKSLNTLTTSDLS